MGAGGIGGRQHEGARLVAGLALAQRSQPIVGAGERELGGPEAGDEVAAAHAARVLHGLEHVVHRGEAAKDALGVDGLAGEHAVAIEQRSGERGAPLGLRGRATGARDERPAALAPGRAHAARSKAQRARSTSQLLLVCGGALQVAAQRRRRVVGDLAGPHQIPECAQQIPREGARLGHQIGEEERAPLLEERAQPRGEITLGPARRRREQRPLIDQVERDLPVARAERLDPDPDDLPGGGEPIEIPRAVAPEPRGEHVALQHRGGERRALELLEHREQRLRPRP